MLGSNMELYINDILVKLIIGELNANNLHEAFEFMRPHNVLPDSSKCVF